MMKKYSLVPIFLGVFLTFFAVMAFASNDTNNTSASNQLTQLLSGFTTYQAKFKQVTIGDRGPEGDGSTGTMALKRPGMFKWTTNKPLKQIIVAANGKMWVYDVDLQQVSEQKTSSRGGEDPAAFLSGNIGSIKKDFTVSRVKVKDQHWFQLKPKDKDSEFQRILLRFHDGKLAAVKVQSQTGQMSIFTFSDVKINQPIANSVFEFTPPQGVEVVSE